MAMTMAPQHSSREDSDSHGGSHELDDSNTDTSNSRVRVADAGLRRAIESSSSSTTEASQDKYGQRRPRRRGRAVDDVVRLSATFTRCHPSPDPPSPEPSPPPQESGEGENKAAAAASIRRRKKCRPKHRCPTTNESISSILKPYPKYLPSSTILQSFSSEKESGCDDTDNHSSSLTSTSSTATTSSTTSLTLKKPSRLLRRGSTQSEPSLPAASMHSFFLPPLNGKPLSKTQKRPSCDSLDQQWVPNGMDFSSSVEVHVFHVK